MDTARFCPDCGVQLSSDAQFCAGCGNSVRPVARFCAECGASVSPGAEFCASCGSARNATSGASTSGFSSEHTPRAQRSRASSLLTWRPKWLVAAAGVVVIALALGLGLGLGLRDRVPVVETPMTLVSADQLVGETWEETVTPAFETEVIGRGAQILVPKGAVTQPTPVNIVGFTGSYGDFAFGTAPLDVQTVPGAGEDSEFYALSGIYDVGPAGTQFLKPATVSLFYHENELPQGGSEDEIFIAYFDGEQWRALPTRVDKDANTASVALTAFDGTMLEVVTSVAGTAASAAGNAARGFVTLVKRLYDLDPIQQGIADIHVRPNDAGVVEWAQRAVVFTRTEETVFNSTAHPETAVALSDHEAVRALVDSGADLQFGYRDVSGSIIMLGTRYTASSGTANNWQMPNNYFGPSNLYGDCTDHGNAATSVLRNLGYPARAAFGYRVQSGARQPHVWTEVLLEGLPYVMDDDGQLYSPTDLTRHGLERAQLSDDRYAMWDEVDQYKYDPNWWVAYLNTTTTTLATEDTTPDTPPAVPVDIMQLPIDNKDGLVLQEYRPTMNPSEPGTIYGIVTCSRSYEWDGESRFSICVCKVAIVGGQADYASALRVISVDTNASGAGEASAQAAAAVSNCIAANGLVDVAP